VAFYFDCFLHNEAPINQQGSFMKYTMQLIYGLALIATLCACGGGEGSGVATAPDASSTASSTSSNTSIAFDPDTMTTVTQEQADALNKFAQSQGVFVPNSSSPSIVPADMPRAILKAAAPPLTQLYMWAVQSSQQPQGEYMTQLYQGSTVLNHGGAQMFGYVWVIGYGQNTHSTMNGANAPIVESRTLCYTTTWVLCAAGQTVKGFLNKVDLSGYQNGLFAFSQTSQTSPWNTMQASIYIQ
jgi:hypothetical protein